MVSPCFWVGVSTHCGRWSTSHLALGMEDGGYRLEVFRTSSISRRRSVTVMSACSCGRWGGGARQSNTKLDVQFRPPRRKCGEASKVRQVKGSAPTVAVASVERWKVMAAHSDFEAGPFVCCPVVLKCDVWLVWQAYVPKTIYNTQEKAISSVRAQH